MKLIPSSGYMIVEETSLATVDSNDLFPAPNEKFHKVTAVSQDQPLCKVGDVVILDNIVKHIKDGMVAREADVMAWVEDNE